MIKRHIFLTSVFDFIIQKRKKEEKREVKNNLKKLLERHHMSIERLCEELELGKRDVREMAKEKTCLGLSDCILICDYFNCSLDYLLCKTDIPIRICIKEG